MNIDNLLVDFDEMGFVPTTLCENPEEYAREWKRQLVSEIERLKEENEYPDRTDEERYQEAEANVRAGIVSGNTSCHWCEDIICKKAVKEFADKLKETIFDYLGVKTIEEANELSLINSTLTYDVVTDRIDELLKEHEK